HERLLLEHPYSRVRELSPQWWTGKSGMRRDPGAWIGAWRRATLRASFLWSRFMRGLAQYLVLPLAIAIVGPAAGQNAHWFCAVTPPSFAASAENRLSCAEFDRLHAGHDIVYQRR